MEELKYYIEKYYGGPIPDFDEIDWRHIEEEYEYTYFLYTPKEIIRAIRIHRPTEAEWEYIEAFVDRHAPKDANGEITEEDWQDTINLAREEMQRMGLVRIAKDLIGLRDRKYKAWTEGHVDDNSAYYK
jgi:hypothetical protein